MVDLENTIYINDYISFNPDHGRFELTSKAQEIIYRQKNIICSYSGSVEWGHEFFCELIDLYSGSSKYNYALGTVVHKEQIEKMYNKGHRDEVTEWVKRHKDDYWFTKAAAMFAKIIEDLPEL